MVRYHSAKSGTRRWPMAVFFNCLDLAALNAWVLYREVTGSNISRRNFLLKLVTSLCGYDEENVQIQGQVQGRPALLKRRQCQIGINRCENKSSAICSQCTKVCCGKHTHQKTLRNICASCYK